MKLELSPGLMPIWCGVAMSEFIIGL